MKQFLIVSLLIAVSVISIAQPVKKPVKTTTVKTTPAPKILKTLNDSASYAIGVSVGNFYKQQGVTKLNTALVAKAITDLLAGKASLMDDATANTCMNTYMSRLQEEKSKPNIVAGEKFLTQNKLKPGVKTTASGLQYKILRDTLGEKPVATDSVTCNYAGTLVDGTEFDNSYKRGQPITFSLRGVIAGWTEGLQLMSVGSKYKFYVPYQIGYGAFDYGPIPGGSTLIFEIELLAIKKVPATNIKTGN